MANAKTPTSVGLLGNAAELLPEIHLLPGARIAQVKERPRDLAESIAAATRLVRAKI